MEQTLAYAFELEGIGLHSGINTRVKVLPAKPQQGRYFVRVDLPHQPVIPATIESVSQTTLSTELAQENAKVRTVEHLLAALVGSGINNARIEINGSEVPLMDGSAKVWVEAISSVGIQTENSNHPEVPLTITQAIWIQENDAFVAAIPASETRFTYGIDFDTLAIGNQWYSWNPHQETFENAIAPARTFTLAKQIEPLQKAGLIKGGNLDNALVCDQLSWLNPPLRFTNEPVRHKLLDLVGDLSLLGKIPQAHFLAYKASHNLHIQLARAIKKSQSLTNYVHND